MFFYFIKSFFLVLCTPSVCCSSFLVLCCLRTRWYILVHIIIQYAGPPECNFKTTWRCMIECRRFIISCNNENMWHLYVLSININHNTTKSLLKNIKIISLLPQHSITSRVLTTLALWWPFLNYLLLFIFCILLLLALLALVLRR